MKGIDLSHYQAGLDPAAAADAGCRFVLLKLTEGAALADEAAPSFYTRANRAGLPAGGYCYSHALTPEAARAEARFLLSRLGGFPMPLGLYLDVEEPGQLALPKEQIKETVLAWCGTVREAGYIPGVYGSEYNLWAKLSPGDLPEDALIWVARYGREPDMPCDLWQSSDSGSVPGYDGPVDTDEVRSARFLRLVLRDSAAGAEPDGLRLLEALCDLTQRQAEIIKKQAAENVRLRSLMREKGEVS